MSRCSRCTSGCGRCHSAVKDPPRPQWSLLPASIASVVELLTWAAATKHRDEQGRAKPLDEQYDSLMRHIMAWRAGEKTDHESGQHPLVHAAARLLFMIELEKTKETK